MHKNWFLGGLKVKESKYAINILYQKNDIYGFSPVPILSDNTLITFHIIDEKI